MQLKDLGNLSIAKNIISQNADSFSTVSEAVEILGNKSKIAALNVSKLSDVQKVQILVNQGLSYEEAKTALTTTALSTAEATATASTTGFGTALKGLWATMIANPLIMVATLVTAGISIWGKCKQSIEETRQATSDAANAFDETSTSINDYADKYKKLHDELIKANTTEERQQEIKTELLSLQQELNDKYGDEYGKVNLVTDAYNDQTEAIKNLNKAAAQRFLHENAKGLDDAEEQMTKQRSYTVANALSTNTDVGKEIYEYINANKDLGITAEANVAGGKNTGTFTLKVNADATEANKSIDSFMSYLDTLKEKYGEDNIGLGDIFDTSSNALNKSQDIIDEFGKEFKKKLIAEITTDNDLSAGFEKATDAVTKYNDALASGDETKILSARNDLNVVKNSIDLTSDDWKKYGNLMTEIFDQADTGIYDFRDALTSNEDGMLSYIKSIKDAKLSKEDLLSMADDGNEDYFDELVKGGEKYNLTVEQIIDELIRMGVVQGDLSESSSKAFAPLSKQELITNINSMSDGFESLDKIMNSMMGKDPFDYTLLDDKKFKDNFAGMGEAYTDFIEKVSSSPKDVNAAQDAFNNLLTTWIDSSGVLNGLTEENTGLATAMLQNMGVANAEEVVTSRLAVVQEHLAAQKAYTAEVSNELANATANEIPAILDEATNSDIAKVALAGLVLEKQFFNGNKLDTSGDIENIISLVGVIGTANTALKALNTLKNGGSLEGNIGGKEGYDSIVRAAQKEADEAVAAAANYKGKGSAVNTIYGGGVDTNKTSGSGKDKSNTTQEIDWIERGTKVLQDEYAKLEELANKDTIAYLGLTQEEFDNAKSIFDNGLGNTIDGLSQLQAYADKAGLSLGELYTMIQSGAPSASKENALQSMLKMQTETLLPQYQREVEAYSKSYEDALKAIPSEYKDKIEHGGVDIESLPSDLGKKVQAAMDDYEKLKSSEKQLADGETEHIETITKLYDNRINKIDIENEKLEQSNKIIKSQIELMEARGEIVGADFYERQIKNNKGLISGNQQDIAEWESEMADLRKANVSTDSKVYKELQAKVKSARNEIYGLKLEQEELNKTLEQMPIDNLNTLISMYKDISATIENWGNVYSATGKKLNADYFQTLISNGATTIDQYKELASKIENVMDDQEEGSTRWNELYEQLQSVNSEMSSMVQNLKKWNEELLKMPLENISNYSSELQKVADGLSNVKSEYDTVVSAVTGAIKDQIDAINEQKDAVNGEYDAQKKALQDKLDLLNKQNTELQLQQKYEQALYNLQKANQQATEKVIRDGQVVYEQNADTLREAQEAVQDAKFDMETNQIQIQIDDLQETLDGLNEKYQDQIDSLQKISDKWSEISDKITQAQNEAKASEILGPGWKDKVLSGNDTALFNTFSGMYANTAEQLKKYQDQIDSTNNIQSLLEDYVNSYKEGTITYDEALKGINGLLSQLNKTMSASGNLQNIFDYLGTVNDTASNADAVLVGIQSGLKDTATELLKSLEQYNKNSGMISEYTSSWQQLTDNVASMLDVLREVRDNLENASNEDEDDDDDDDKTSSNGWGTGDVNNGPGVSRKDGITRGLIGSSSESDREASMKLLGLKKLDPDEIPAVLHMGEAVFNSDQQQKLLENFGTAWNYKPSVPDYSSLLSNVNVTNKTETPMITLNGGINIQKSDTPDELAKGIMDGKLGLALGQRLGKR